MNEPIEARLLTLLPTAPAWDRDAILIAAGEVRGRKKERQRWTKITGCLGMFMGGWLFLQHQSSEPLIIEKVRIVTERVEIPIEVYVNRPTEVEDEEPDEESRDWQHVRRMFQVRSDVLKYGVEILPVPAQTSSVPDREPLEEWLGLPEDSLNGRFPFRIVQ
jgi:hypothetical protein